MTIEFSSLRQSDVVDAALLHEQAFPSFFLSSLGQPFLRQFYRGFIGDHTAVTVVARSASGELLGTVVGTTEPAGFFGRLVRRRFLGFVGASASAAIRTPQAIPRLIRAVRYRGSAGDQQADGVLLSSICVAPHAQGAGVGHKLISAWEISVRATGARCAYLTTDSDENLAVNAFYSRAGWTAKATYTTAEGRPMNLYTKDLELI